MKEQKGRLQQEIRQTIPFASRREEAVLGILRTADQLRREVGRLVAAHGITHQQYNVLRILRGAGERGLPILEISERLIEQSPGITRFVDQLEQRGMICRDRCSEDRRRVFCKILPAGLSVLEDLDQPLRDWTEARLGILDHNEVTTLIQLLDRARSSR